jgi:hypothetical protein
MLIVLPILLLIGIPLFLVSLRFLRPKTGILWLISALTALAVWIMLMIFRLKIPDSATFGLGKSLSFSFITTFLLDKISWPYAWALIASLLAMILTSVVYRSVEDSPSPNWTIWPQGSLLAGLGLSAIFAGNLYTLILSWTAIDLFLLYLMVTNLNSTQDALVSFAIRVAGTFVAIGAILANSQGTPISLPLVNQNVNTLVFIGSLIRLGSIGVSWKARQLSIPQQGMKSFINLVLVTSVLVVITRGSSSGISSNLIPIFLVIISIVAMIFGIMAYLTIKEMWWRFYWIMGFSAISIVAAIQGEVEASPHAVYICIFILRHPRDFGPPIYTGLVRYPHLSNSRSNDGAEYLVVDDLISAKFPDCMFHLGHDPPETGAWRSREMGVDCLSSGIDLSCCDPIYYFDLRHSRFKQ